VDFEVVVLGERSDPISSLGMVWLPSSVGNPVDALTSALSAGWALTLTKRLYEL
jgi:hypothetical protein